MTGYNIHHVRHFTYLGRHYMIIKHGDVRVICTATDRSKIHGERGRVR